jgi:DNA-binding transcriptional ArsR family regulator
MSGDWREQLGAIEDAQTLRAMAHPLRIRLIGLLRRDGPATASELARRLDESSGSTSYHLRILAKYGFIEDDAERSHGRERFWRSVDAGSTWSSGTDDAGMLAADSATTRVIAREYQRWIDRWQAQMPEWSRPWRAAAESGDQIFELTSDELRELSDRILEVIGEFADRRERRPGTERSLVIFHTFPARREDT